MATQHQQKEACPMKKILFLVFTIILCLSLGACSKDTSLNLIPTDPPTTVHTHTPGAVATCTEDQTCTICGEILTVATGHIEIIDSAIAPTCTSTGLTEGAHCSVCGIILKQQEVLPAAHTPPATGIRALSSLQRSPCYSFIPQRRWHLFSAGLGAFSHST